MAQTRTAAFIVQADAADASPVLLVRAALSGGTRYWTSRAGTYGGQVYTELLKEGCQISLGLDLFGRALRTRGSLLLANEGDGGARLSEMFATDVVANRGVEVDYIFSGLTHPTDSLRLITGALDVPTEDCFDDQTVRLGIMDDGNPVHAGIQDLAVSRVHQTLGTRYTTTSHPGADPDTLGKTRPIIYGSLPDAPAYPVDAGGCDVLDADISAAATAIGLSDADLWAIFPASGTVQIEDEKITYTSKDTASLELRGCTRGTGGTTGAAHVAGRQCYEVAASYVYEVAAHACKAVANVRVDGRLIDPSAYSVSLAGPTTITFNTKILRALAVAVTTQPTFSATTVAEQTPGTVSISSEQTPGSVTVSAEHTNTISSEGSHDHATDTVTHEYGTGTGLPGTVSSTTTVTFATTPKAGTSATIKVTVYVYSGTWQLKNGSTVLLSDIGSNLAAGQQDYYCVDSSPGTTYSLYEASAGSISIASIERDVVSASASSADAASGVSAGRSGSTAASMASLSGSTAANMATLAGATAISLAQTANTVASAADVVVGTQVICDVDGYADDGSGTYTGTPSALITNPADQIRHILAVHLGLSLATWADTTTFTAARAAFAASGIRCDWGLYDQMDSAEVLERLRWSVASRLFQAADGKFRLFALPLSSASVKTLTEADDVPSPKDGGRPLSVGRSDLADLYNQVVSLGAKRLNGDGYGTSITVADATSQSTYRMTRTLLIENDFVRDATALDAIADIYLAWHKDQQYRVRAILYARPWLHIEPCDKIAITSARMPGGWTAKEFWVEQIQYSVGTPGRLDQAALVLRSA